jgi:hypothetical protein
MGGVSDPRVRLLGHLTARTSYDKDGWFHTL